MKKTNAGTLELLDQFEKDSSWIHRRFERLRKRYPGQFAAVYRGRLISHARNLASVEDELREVCPEALGRAAVEYLPKNDLVLLL